MQQNRLVTTENRR